jgi:twinkle protein
MKTFGDYGIDISNLRGHGEERKTTCPQCSPSRKKSRYPCLNVNLDKGVWHCWHCDWSGSIQRGEESKAKYLPTKPVYRKPVAPPLEHKPGLREWFAARAIPWEVVQRRGITLTRVYFREIEDEAEAIAFPYYRNGELVNVKYRRLSASKDDSHMRMAAGAERIPYGLDDLQGDTIVWCEGEPDACALEASGVRSVLSVPDGAPIPGAKNYDTKFDFLQNAESYLAPITRHILAVDNDAPGQALAQELARRFGAEKCFSVEWSSECKDANDVLMSYGPEVVKECIDNATPFPVEGLIYPMSFLNAVLALYDHGRPKTLSTGFPSLDPYYRIRVGEWTLVTGVPSHGKSSFLSSLVMQMARKMTEDHGWRFAMCVPEQYPLENYHTQLLQILTDAPFYEGSTQRMGRDEVYRGMEWLQEHFAFISLPEDNPTISQIINLVKVEILRRGCRGLVIDPFNELRHPKTSGERTDEYISEFLSTIRGFTRRNGIHTWVVAHPTKLQKLYKTDEENKTSAYYPVPTAYDVKGASEWFDKGDNILSVWRDVKADDGNVEIHVQKIRFRDCGKPGMAKLKYHVPTGSFSDPLARHAERAWTGRERGHR